MGGAMSLKSEKNKVEQFILEHSLYEKAVAEIEAELMDKGAWGKALVEANGNKEVAEGLYIKHSVELHKQHILLDKIRKQEEQERAADIENRKAQADRIKAKKESEERAQKNKELKLAKLSRDERIGFLFNELKEKHHYDDSQVVKAFNIIHSFNYDTSLWDYQVVGSSKRHPQLKYALAESFGWK